MMILAVLLCWALGFAAWALFSRLVSDLVWWPTWCYVLAVVFTFCVAVGALLFAYLATGVMVIDWLY